MKHWIFLAGLGLIAMTLACGGGDDKTMSEAPPVDAAAPAAEAPAAPTKTPVAEAPAPPAEAPAVAEAPVDATKSCLALAAQQKWSEALEPCTQAAKDHPTDLRVKNAVQQAQAAAEG